MNRADHEIDFGVVRQAALGDGEFTQRSLVIPLAVIERVTSREMRFGRIRRQLQRPVGIFFGQIVLCIRRLNVVINPAVQNGEVGDGEDKLGVELDGALVELCGLFQLPLSSSDICKLWASTKAR